MPEPGRSCRPGYRYWPCNLAGLPEIPADTLYVIGGLYGNLPALETILDMAAREPVRPVLVFNGDFNWFNSDDAGFTAVNQLVSAHQATLGNVEAELVAADALAGCGCAYPPDVDAALVQRSNRIHARLRKTAARHPAILGQLAALPMFCRYRVGPCAVCVLHGDSQSLAGWKFAAPALREPQREAWLLRQFQLARADVFASSHTCLPALKTLKQAGRKYCVINNGAAGMPNFTHCLHGVFSRVSKKPSLIRPLYGIQQNGVHIDALPVEYDQERWKAIFLSNWPEGTAAHLSYFQRISTGVPYTLREALITG